MHPHPRHFPYSSSSAFTLIELLVVIAIIAILAVVVVLTLNPAQLLQQSRDANRVSDMATLNSALSLYSTDLSGTSGFSLGNASSAYLSLPDTSSSCGNLGLPTSSGNFSYACASNVRSTNGTGWIPLDFTKISAGTPFGNLPVDPVNQTSSNLYYAYSANSGQYEVTSVFESSKYKQQYANNPINPNFPGLNSQGSSIAASLLYNPQGLATYWPLNEGTGTIAYDKSGNGRNGIWTGTASGTSGYYAAGKIGQWAGWFDGASTTLTASSAIAQIGQSALTASAWVNTNLTGQQNILENNGVFQLYLTSANKVEADIYASSSWKLFNGNAVVPVGQWSFVAMTYDGQAVNVYVNGILDASTPKTGAFTLNPSCVQIGRWNSGTCGVGTPYFFSGSINDARIYNRALSAAEILALYNATK